MGTPLVPVIKPNETIRLCADYKITVNPFLEDIKYPLPRVEELFVALQGGEHFPKLDFSQAYNQQELTEKTKSLLAWSTHKGIYVPNRLPYGTKPACALFQKLVEKMLQGSEGVINFLDDVVVTGKDREQHMRNLEVVFQKLRNAGLTLNLDKCKFFESEIEYLGHIIDKSGLKKSPNKEKAIVNAQRP